MDFSSFYFISGRATVVVFCDIQHQVFVLKTKEKGML